MTTQPGSNYPGNQAESGLPTALPTGSFGDTASSQASGESGALRAGKEPAVHGSFTPEREAAADPDRGSGVHAAPRISAKQLERIAASLSQRDWNILHATGVYRFITAKHLTQMFFHDHASDASASRTARRVLARLRSLRILGVVQRRIGGIRAGSEGMVYYLDTAGERLHRKATSSSTHKRFEEPSARFMDHTLAITTIAADLHQEARLAGAEIVSLAPEPRRTYTAPHGDIGRLAPDMATELAARPGAEEISAFFLEIDLGHESLPTLVNKCMTYEKYRASGEEQRHYGGFPRIVWIMDSPKPNLTQRRIDALTRALEEHPQIPHHLYTVTTLTETAKYLIKEAGTE